MTVRLAGAPGVRLFAVAVAVLPCFALAQIDELDNTTGTVAVQERTFRMMQEINISIAALPADPYTKSFCAQGAYVSHFSDYFAWQIGRGGYCLNTMSPLREQLERDFGALRTQFEEIQFFAGTDVLIKPFYGKISVANQTVVNGEAFLILGATLYKFTNAFRPAVDFGIGFRAYVTKWFSVRFDLTDAVVIPTGTQPKVGNVLSLQLGVSLNIGGTE